MDFSERIIDNLIGAHLQLGKIDHKPYKAIGTCFFIVEQTQDKEFILKQIRQLLVAGCGNYVFYGKYAKLWHMEADLECILLYPKDIEEHVLLTMDWKVLDEFVENIFMTISERTIVPFENYLFYDNRDIYEIVLKRLKEWRYVSVN